MPPSLSAIQEIMTKAGVTHSNQALTLEQAAQAVSFAHESFEFGKLLSSKPFREFVKDENNAVALYELHKSDFVYDFYQPSYLQDLKAFAYDRGFPDHFDSVSQIMAYRKAEQVEFLVKSPAFVKFTNDLESLQTLLRQINKEKNLGKGNFNAWDRHTEFLRTKLSSLWLKLALVNDKLAETPPILEKGKNWFNPELKKDKISQSALFREYLNDWRNAQRLWLNLRDAKAPLKTIAFVKGMAKKRFLDHLKDVKTVDDVYNIVRLVHGQDSLKKLQQSKQYKAIIQDPLKAFELYQRLRYQELKYRSIPFLDSLQLASRRNYKTQEDVLATIKTVEAEKGANYFYLGWYEPFKQYISDADNAKNLFNAIEKDPAKYPKFRRDMFVYRKLKIAASKHLFPEPGAGAEEIVQSYETDQRFGSFRARLCQKLGEGCP